MLRCVSSRESLPSVAAAVSLYVGKYCWMLLVFAIESSSPCSVFAPLYAVALCVIVTLNKSPAFAVVVSRAAATTLALIAFFIILYSLRK